MNEKIGFGVALGHFAQRIRQGQKFFLGIGQSDKRTAVTVDFGRVKDS